MRKSFACVLALTMVMGLTACSGKGKSDASDLVASPEQLRVPRVCDYRDEYVQLGYSTDGVYKSVDFCDSFVACSREFYTDEAELALQNYDYFGPEHLPVNSDGEVCVTQKSLVVYGYEGNVLACVDLAEVFGNMFYAPVLTIDYDENIHVVAEVRELNIDEYQYYEAVFSSSGEVMSVVNLELGGNYRVCDIACGSDGVTVLRCEDDNFMGHLICADSVGTMVSHEDEIANGCYDVITVDGSVYCAISRMIENSCNTLLVPLDNVLECSDSADYVLPVSMTSLCSYTNGVLYYDELNENICFFNFADSSSVTLMNGSDYEGIFGFANFYLDSSDNLLSIGTNGIDSVYYLCKYIPLEEGYVDEREVLVIGGAGISDNPIIRNMVFRFNMSQDEYRLDIFDYGFLSGDDLLTEYFFQMSNGEAPDILVDFPFDGINGEDYLVNLTPYIESSLDLSEYNSLLINSNGEHYYLPSSYEIYGLLTDNENTGRMDTIGQFWDLDSACSGGEYAAVLANISCSDLMTQMLQINMGRFFDVENHCVRFDSDEFRELLRFVNYVGNTNVFREEGDYSSYLLTNSYTMYDFYTYGDIGHLLMLETYEFQRDVSFVGLPSSDGAVYGIVPHYNFAISCDCEYPDAAWSFINGSLGYDIQIVCARMGFAVNNEANREVFEQHCHDLYVSGALSDYDVDEIADEFEAILGSTGVVAVNDPQLMVICMEAADSYFGGAKDEYEVSSIIQNQAQTIMNERY